MDSAFLPDKMCGDPSCTVTCVEIHCLMLPPLIAALLPVIKPGKSTKLLKLNCFLPSSSVPSDSQNKYWIQFAILCGGRIFYISTPWVLLDQSDICKHLHLFSHWILGQCAFADSEEPWVELNSWSVHICWFQRARSRSTVTEMTEEMTWISQNPSTGNTYCMHIMCTRQRTMTHMWTTPN